MENPCRARLLWSIGQAQGRGGRDMFGELPVAVNEDCRR
jgi:hypothetical protein